MCFTAHRAEDVTVQVGGDAGGGGIEADVEAGLVQAELGDKLRSNDQCRISWLARSASAKIFLTSAFISGVAVGV